MRAGTFQTWLVLERLDDTVERILKDLGEFANTNGDERCRISLEFRDETVVLTMLDPKALFNQVFGQRPSPLCVVSLAPHDQIRNFDSKVFQFDGGRYALRCASTDTSVFYRRFLFIEYLETGVYIGKEALRTEVVGGIENPEGPLLWTDPKCLELDESQVSRIFDFDSERRRLSADMSGAFFLPPSRTINHPDLRSLTPPEREGQRPISYFARDLVTLRKALGSEVGGAGSQPNEPTAMTMERLIDEPLLTDLLLDGGGIEVTNEEGGATRIRLIVREGEYPGSAYRARSVLDPATVDGPPWSSCLLTAICDDIRSLVSGGWDVKPSKIEVNDDFRKSKGGQEELAYNQNKGLHWTVNHLRNYRPGGYDGSWEHLKQVRDSLQSPHAQTTFDETVLLDTRQRADADSPPDNDLAEMLFISHVWRCPWSDDPETASWRLAMIDLIRDELVGLHVTPEDRVATWNEDSSGEDAVSFRLEYTDRDSTTFRLRYTGDPDEKHVLKWRLLLPLGTIVNARTILLDRLTRSVIDNGLVLA